MSEYLNKETYTQPGQIYDGTHYLVLGPEINEKVICCVHGIGSDHSNWYKLGDAMRSEGYTVVLYDLLGRGFSEKSTNDHYGQDEHIEQLHNLLVFLKYPRVHIIGHSMGGALVTLFVVRYPEMNKSVTLLAPAGLMNNSALDLVRSCCPCFQNCIKAIIQHPANQEQEWRKIFYHHDGISRQIEEEFVIQTRKSYAHNKHAFEAFWKSALEFPLCRLDSEVASLAAIDGLPVFLLWGDHDLAVPSDNFMKWKAILNKGKCNASYQWYNEAAHAFFLEYPEQTNGHIAAFLNSVERKQEGQLIIEQGQHTRALYVMYIVSSNIFFVHKLSYAVEQNTIIISFLLRKLQL